MTLDIYSDCPSCGGSWDAGPIPEKDREHFSPPYRFSKLIWTKDSLKIEKPYWQCPHCEWNTRHEPRDT